MAVGSARYARPVTEAVAGPVSGLQRAMGAVVGSAVGDALGAPFEFGPAGAFSKRFPGGASADEMCGGGGWEPGEATDDTQMAVLVADSLLERGGLDLPDMFARFQRWAGGEPKDIGLQTEAVLSSSHPWDKAAPVYFRITGRAAGNGALMRAATSAVYFAKSTREESWDAARRISALTHGDPAAWEGTAILHDLVRIAVRDGADPLSGVDDALAVVRPEHRERYAVVLAPDWEPRLATEFNGAVWPCLGCAVWAVRRTDSFEGALRAAVDVGGDTDTVAAVTGALAGARYGIDAVPERWIAALHVPIPGWQDRVLRAQDLMELATRLSQL
jgi:ADP-ribosylglycohydrolase